MDREHETADRLYKSHFGKMVAAMLRFSADIDLEMAEDLVQDAFYIALSSWKHSGIPENTAGWMYTVCRNNAINTLKKIKRSKNPFEQNSSGGPETEEDIFDDRKMQLLFACAHPRLSAKMQVVITLKYVANLRIGSIANALGLTVGGIDRMLAAAKQRLRLENILLKEPAPRQLQERLPAVHKILYLLFNEGYRAGSGKELIRKELCEESLVMIKSLLDNRICNADTEALYALLLFNAARLDTRLGAAGDLSDLSEQDRSRWNAGLIDLADHHLARSAGGPVSSYHYEASIAALHCHAKSFADTDWTTISQLYRQLLKNNPNPFVQLNYAIALYYGSQKQEAFGILHDLERTFLKRSYLLYVTLGRLSLLENQYDEGYRHLKKAVSLTDFQAEKDFVSRIFLTWPRSADSYPSSHSASG